MKNVIKAVLIVVVVGIVGRMDYADAVQQDKEYCDNVEKGAWGAYNEDIDCGKVKAQ